MIITIGTILKDSSGGTYEVTDQLGQGGFGTVYQVIRQSDSMKFALKTLPTNFERPTVLESFKNEAKLALSIRNENVIEYLYFHDGSAFPELPPFIIMELANNGNLKTFLDDSRSRNTFLDESTLLGYMLQLASGMEAINSKLVHRDIKPANILIKDGMLKIADFGLAKIVDQTTRTKTFKGYGTFEYFAPEAWRGESNTIQMDIYAMGLVFYELATCAYPYVLPSADDIQAWSEMHLFADAKDPLIYNPALNQRLRQIIQKMIEKKVSVRFQSWAEIRRELESANQPKGQTNPHLQRLLNKRLEVDNSARQKALEAEKNKQELESIFKTTEYQFRKEIFDPLKEFIDNFNQSYQNGKIEIQKGPSEMKYNIRLVSGMVLKFNFQHLKDDDFIRKRRIHDYGMIHDVSKLERPIVENRKVVCWGYIKEMNTNKGFNVLLLEKQGEIYGEWLSMFNSVNPMSNIGRRPEPFAFDLDQLEEALKFLRVVYQYESSLEKYSIDHSIKLLEEFN